MDPTTTRLHQPTAAVHAGIWLAALLPALYWIRLLPRFGRLQYNDYYGNVAQVLDGGAAWSWDPLRWLLLKSNEHTVAIPTLLYAINHGLSAGDNRGLSLWAIVAAFVTAGLVATMAVRALGLGPLRAPLLAAGTSALLFSPAMAHSYVMGFSGTIWLTANLLAICAVFALSRQPPTAQGRDLWPVVGYGILGALTYSTTMSLWPALLVGCLLLGLGRRPLLAIASAAAGVAVLQLVLRHRPESHPAPTLDSPWRMLEYLGVYLAWPLTGDLTVAAALGGLAAAGGLGLVVLAFWRRRSGPFPAAAPFAMLLLYGLFNGVGTAIGRAGFGVEQASSSRYSSLAMLFWLGLIGLAAMLLASAQASAARQRLVAILPLTILLVAAAATWLRSAEVRDRYLTQAAWHPLAEIALRQGAADDHWVLRHVNNIPGQLPQCLGWLQQLSHVPFDRPVPTGRTEVLDPALIRSEDALLVGQFDGLAAVPGGMLRAQGWAIALGGQLAEALLLDANGRICGELAVGLPRPDVAQRVSTVYPRSGVFGYVAPGQASGPVRMVVRRLGERHYTPLRGQHRLPELTARGGGN